MYTQKTHETGDDVDRHSMTDPLALHVKLDKSCETDEPLKHKIK